MKLLYDDLSVSALDLFIAFADSPFSGWTSRVWERQRLASRLNPPGTDGLRNSIIEEIFNEKD